MPLSEHEQRMLDQIAERLQREDPKLASKLGSRPVEGVPWRVVAMGALAVVVGCVVLIMGIGTHVLALGVTGFAVMSFGAYFATLGLHVHALRAAPGGDRAQGQSGPGQVGRPQ
jgi:hypothetical protein